MPETLIKVCGLTTPETLDAAVAAGATHIGLNFYPPSPRFVSIAQATALRARTPNRVRIVLVVVMDEAPAETLQAIDAIKPDVVQFHGGETPQMLSLLKAAGLPELWKAVGVKDAAALDRARQWQGVADRVLFDAPAQAMPGGTGLAVDWRLFQGFRPEMDWGLAGGLNPGNVAEAIRLTGAPLVDASSGLESAPGVKDVDLIRAFCQAARSV